MRRYSIEIGGTAYSVSVDEVAADRYNVSFGDGETYDVHVASTDSPAPGAPATTAAPVVVQAPVVRATAAATHGGALRAPLPGSVVSVAVQAGERVTRGQVLVTMETMKMQNPLRAPQDGEIAEVCVQAGQTVAHNDVLVRFKDA